MVRSYYEPTWFGRVEDIRKGDPDIRAKFKPDDLQAYDDAERHPNEVHAGLRHRAVSGSGMAPSHTNHDRWGSLHRAAVGWNREEGNDGSMEAQLGVDTIGVITRDGKKHERWLL